MDIQSEIIDAWNDERQGDVMEVLCEGFDGQSMLFVGRSYAESPDIDGRIYFSAPLGAAGRLVGVDALHLRRARPLLGGIGKHARAQQLLLAQEIAQLVELLLALAGQARDDGRAQHEAGDALAELIEQGAEVFLVAAAVHLLEDLIVAVLERNVKVFQNFVLAGDHVDQAVVDPLGIEVVQADPMEIELAKLL